MLPHARRAAERAVLAAALTLAGASTRAHEPPGAEPVELRLMWADVCGMPPELLLGASRHVQDLLRPAGVQVLGRRIELGLDQPTQGVIAVLLERDPGRGAEPAVGGAARVDSDRQITVWIFPPFIAGGIGLDFSARHRWRPVEKLRFERALALVVVHELGHALAGAGHRPAGLMAARFDRSQLDDVHLAVDPDLQPALRAAVARLKRQGTLTGDRPGSTVAKP